MLTRLPFNEKFMADLKSLNSIKSPQDFDTLLDVTSIHKLLYSLLITAELLEQDKNYTWATLFTDKQGLNHLYKILCTVESDQTIGAHLSIKFNSTLFGLISQLSQLAVEEIPIVTSNFDRIVTSTLARLS
jgi:hypothetical protein